MDYHIRPVVNMGYLVVKYSTCRNGFACGVTKVTAKGLAFLYDLLNEDNVA